MAAVLESKPAREKSTSALAMSGNSEAGCLAEELADAKLPPKTEVLAILESLTLSFLESLAKGEDPSLHLVMNYK